MSHPERIDPDTTEPGILALHLKRYDFALPFCTGADVLDAACGAGYGAAHLAKAARAVVGVDLDDETVRHAERRYALSNVTFRAGDVSRLDDPDESYDVVCSFETIEHVDDAEQTLSEFSRVLRSNGVLLISTPNAASTTSAPSNPHHHTEWTYSDFRRMLGRFFGDVELYGQRRRQSSAHRFAQRMDILGLRRHVGLLRRGSKLLGTPSTAELTLDDVVVEYGALAGATEIVAVCRAPRRT
jgi:ubiquinone/menaquinone biosynthesis C-methylase UbiE